MSDIDVNAVDNLMQDSVKLLKIQSNRLPAMRKMLVAMKEMGEDVTDAEASLKAIEDVYKSAAVMLKTFPKKV